MTDTAIEPVPDSTPVVLDEATRQRLREACRASLFFLAKGVLGYKDFCKEVHLPVCNALQRRDRKRKAVLMPRTWFKTSINIAYCIWSEINNSNIRQLFAQNTFSNAEKKVREVKAQWDGNVLLRALFPELLPDASCQWSDKGITLKRSQAMPECTLEPAGTGTQLTSRHYYEIIEDDTVAPDFDAMTGEIQQPTVAEIEKAKGFHKLCHSLLLHPTESYITLTGTRWAVEDLFGEILSKHPEYLVLTRATLEDSNGNPASEEQGGRPVWDRFGTRAIEELRRVYGTLMFEMLYMNSPSSSINSCFKRDMVRYYDNLPTELLYCTSVDLASAKPTKTSDPDYVVVITSAIKPSTGDVFVVHYNRGRFDPGETIVKIFDHWRAYHPMIVYVESTQYQATLKYWIEQRQKETGELFYVEQVPNCSASKAARILGMEPWFAAGRVRMRVGHSDLERELLAFDKDRVGLGHDDVIDALSMQRIFWSQATENWRKEREAELVIDPHSGKAIVDELLQRASLAQSYPYDIGLMGDRLKAILPRTDYVIAQEVTI